MSELVLVRHGQASFGKASYDKLSDNGIEQVKVLSRHWQQLGERFDHIYSGSLLRQRETAAELLGLVAGKPSAATEIKAFNEYSGDPLMRIYLRDYAHEFGDLQAVQWPITDPRLFQKLFERATAKWIQNQLTPAETDQDFEYWQDFKTRVHVGLNELMAAHPKSSRLLLTTSGGVIAMALQRVLQFPDEHVISTNWMVHNSSVTRIRYSGDRLSLTQFNNLAHLEKNDLAHMVTYR
ncbi:MAG: broad specificity phosphatase PhoE [Pseudohongiellaceae bacterium]|jgi:broad specificity phosphatase PhoE